MIEIIYTQINILPNNIITFKNIYSNHYKLIQQLINHLNIIFLLFMPGVLQLNNINFFETLDIALFFCQFFCIFYSYFLVLCDIIVSGGVSYG